MDIVKIVIAGTITVLSGFAGETLAATSIETGMAPVRDKYRLGETVEIELSIRNAGDKDLAIFFGYPDNTGISFTCEDGAAVPTGLSAGRFAQNTAVSVLQLAKGEEARRIIALNRYMTFSKPKEYVITFHAEFAAPISMQGSHTNILATGGHFRVSIESGGIDTNRVKHYNESLLSSDPIQVAEGAELLLWVDDPMTIDSLILAAKRCPYMARDIVDRLADRIRDARGRDAIFQIAREGDFNALQSALRIMEAKQSELPFELCESVLQSWDSDKVYLMLDHLRKHGRLQHVPLVRALVYHKNQRIRQLAGEASSAIQQRTETSPK